MAVGLGVLSPPLLLLDANSRIDEMENLRVSVLAVADAVDPLRLWPVPTLGDAGADTG